MIGNIIKKEFKELCTAGTLIPIIVVALVFVFVGQMIGKVGEVMQEKPAIGIVDEDDGDFSNLALSVFADKAKVIYQGDDVAEELERLHKENGAALLVLPADFSQNIYSGQPGEIEVYWIMKGAGIWDSIPSGAVEGLIQLVNQEISKKLMGQGYSPEPDLVLKPTTTVETTLFKGKEIRGLSPSQLGNMLAAQSVAVPIVVMMLMIMAGVSVISSMGLEKENKTLETLLTLPVRRSDIVVGKIVGSALVGLIMATIYMFGFMQYMRSFQFSELNLADFGLALGAPDYLLVGISLFMSLLAGLSLCIVLGTFAQNYRSAQTLAFPITGLAMLSMFMVMFKDFDTIPVALRIFMFIIPFSHPMMAMRALMLDNYALIAGGIAYAAVFTAIMVLLSVRIFNSDRLLTGGARKRPAFGKLAWGSRRR